jgi:hypothetical protein
MRHSDCFLVTAFAAFGLVGCSTHPLPQDVSNVSTVDIVKRIRCEAKDGIEDALAKASSQGDYQRRHVERIIKVTTIGYDFTFIMGEDNAAAVTELSFAKGYPPNANSDNFKLTLNASWDNGGNQNMRKNTRTFRVIDRLQDLHSENCIGANTAQANLLYPITGSTGMAEVVRSYIELETVTNLGQVDSTQTATGKQEIVTFSDTLNFITTLETGASATWTFETRVGTVRLTNATLSGSASRTDNHTVVVVLARDAKDDPDRVSGAGPRVAAAHAARAARMAKEAKQEPPVITPVSTAAPTLGIRDKRLQNFLTQRAAVARNRVLFELERRRHVDEDRVVASRVLNIPVP